MPTVTYPLNPDSWCETTLNPLEGDWVPAIVQEITLDNTQWYSGRASVKAYIVNYFQARIDFELKSGYEFDGNKQDAKLHFAMAMEPVFDPSGCRVILWDKNGNSTSQTFGMQISTWVVNEFPLGPSKGWDNETFDWSGIRSIGIEANCSGNKTGSFWIDELCFIWTSPIPLLQILSYDQNGQLANVKSGVVIRKPSGAQDSFDVPFFRTLEIGSYTLVAQEATGRTLNHWKKPDGSTTTEKSIVIDLQGPLTTEMNWVLEGNGSGTSLIVPVVVGSLIIGFALMYYWG